MEVQRESDPVKDDHAQRMLESLDNPIWFALTTEHRLLAAHKASRDDIRRMFHRWWLRTRAFAQMDENSELLP
jgi:hypothetical protein